MSTCFSVISVEARRDSSRTVCSFASVSHESDSNQTVKASSGLQVDEFKIFAKSSNGSDASTL